MSESPPKNESPDSAKRQDSDQIMPSADVPHPTPSASGPTLEPKQVDLPVPSVTPTHDTDTKKDPTFKIQEALDNINLSQSRFRQFADQLAKSTQIEAGRLDAWKKQMAEFNTAIDAQIRRSAWLNHSSIDSTLLRVFAEPELVRQYNTLTSDTDSLRKKLEGQAVALREAASKSQVDEQKIRELEKTTQDLETKERLRYILDRITPEAHGRLLASEEFQGQFLETPHCKAFVVSVDIRRSTELMLKARSPRHFSEFITALCDELMDIVLSNYGVFDKFTGDGILAFFPEFFSGEDSAFRALHAAERCHAAFRERYLQFRTSFKSVLADVGLGIGIDWGQVDLVKIASGLTVVGEPVVYACRLSAAPANVTLLNQPAYEAITARASSYCDISETTIDVKHEGRVIAYQARLKSTNFQVSPPSWLT